MSPILPGTQLLRHHANASIEQYSKDADVNPSALVHSASQVAPRPRESSVSDLGTHSLFDSLPPSPAHISPPLAERANVTLEKRSTSQVQELVYSPMNTLLSINSHGGEARDDAARLAKLQESIGSGIQLASELLTHHSLNAAEEEDLSLCQRPVFPLHAASSMTPSYTKALLEFVKREMAYCSRKQVEEEYYVSEKVTREDALEELNQQLGKLEQDISYMSSQSSMYMEKKKSLFQKSDHTKNSHNHEVANLRRTRERAEHKRKLLELDMLRLEKMARKK